MAEPELGTPAEPELGIRFQRRFLAARPLRSFPWPELEQNLRTRPDSPLLADILHKTVLHPLCVKYPPSTRYRRCFLTELIKKHESTAAEPLDELYEVLAGILNEEESTHCYKNYLLPTGECVTLSESVAIISGGTTGLVTWDAALRLAEWAMENSAVFGNRTVLELGSGIGFTGIAICKTCSPKAYIFSDCHPHVLKQLTENIRLNGFVPEPEPARHIPAEPRGQEAEAASCPKPKLMVAALDWGSVTEERLLDLQPDVVVAAGALCFDDASLRAGLSRLEREAGSCAGFAQPYSSSRVWKRRTDLRPVPFTVLAFSDIQQLFTQGCGIRSGDNFSPYWFATKTLPSWGRQKTSRGLRRFHNSQSRHISAVPG